MLFLKKTVGFKNHTGINTRKAIKMSTLKVGNYIGIVSKSGTMYRGIIADNDSLKALTETLSPNEAGFGLRFVSLEKAQIFHLSPVQDFGNKIGRACNPGEKKEVAFILLCSEIESIIFDDSL